MEFLTAHWLDITTTILGLAYILLEYKGFDAALAGEFERVFEQFAEQALHPVGVFGGHFADGL